MKKQETKVLEQIVNNCSKLSEEARTKVMWITEGMALVGGANNGKETRR